MTAAVQFAVDEKLCKPGAQIAVISGVSKPGTDTVPKFGIMVAPGKFTPSAIARSAGVKTVSLRATAISLDEVFSPTAPKRKTKIVCTIG